MDGRATFSTSRKRTLSLAVTFVAIFALVASACAKQPKASSSGCGKTYTLRLGDANPASALSPMTQLANFFIAQVKANSGGCINVRYFPNSQLGPSTSLLTGVLTGSIDFAQITTGTVAVRDPKWYMYTYPFLASTHEKLYKVFNSPAGQTVLQSLKSQGATGLFLNDNGPFVFLFRKKVTDPAGFQGTKIRAYPDPLNTGIVQKLGAQAVPLDFPQVYSSLQSGVITGVEASPSAFISAKLQEVAKYVLLVVPDWTAEAMLVSNRTMNSLPPNLQAAVTKAAEASKAKAEQLTAPALTGAEAALTKAGFQPYTPASPEAFTKATAALTSSYDSKIGPDLVGQIKEAAAAK